MNILMVTNMYPYEERPSYGAFVKSQIDSIEADGHRVETLFIRGYRSKLAYAGAFATIRKALRQSAFDVVHAHYGLSAIPALPFGPCPLVVSFCGDDLLGTPNHRGGKTLGSQVAVTLSRFASRYARQVIVKSRQMIPSLPTGVVSRTSVIPNGVDFGFFHPMERDACLSSMGLSPQKRHVLFPSTPYEKRKRIDLAEAAVELARDRVPNLELHVVYHQPQENVPVYMNGCDALLMTSDWEGSSNVVKEAMACNTPIVSVDAGDAWEVIDGVQGCYAVDRTPESVADGLVRALSRNERSQGREAIAHLEMGRVAQSITAVYEKAVAGRV